MTPKLTLTVFVILSSVLNSIVADGDSHHHRVIIHVPYKIHTIHHTILKHVHHHDKGSEDKYEVLGYTIGKPIELGHNFHSNEQLHHHPPPPPPPPAHMEHHQPHHHYHPEMEHHEFSGNNELGHGHEQHEWTPSFGLHDFSGGGGHHGSGSHFEPHHAAAPAPHFENHHEPSISHDYGGHAGFAGYE